MANLEIHIKDLGVNPLPSDMDVRGALNDRRILELNAVDIIKKNPSLMSMYFDLVCEFKFDWLSNEKCKRTTLSTGSEEEYIGHGKWGFFIRDQLSRGNRYIFGTPLLYTWYSEPKSLDMAKVNEVWDMIQAQTSFLKSDYTKYQYKTRALRDRLILPVADFDNAKARDLSESLQDGSGNTVENNKYKVDWRTIRGVSEDTVTKILDPKIPIDFRGFADYDMDEILQLKVV